MLIFVAGYPGPAAIWSGHVVRDLCALKGPSEIVFAGTQAELIRAMLRSRAEWSVVHMPHPGNRMIAALREAGPALIVVRDDPRHTLMTFLDQWKTPLPDAIRAIASGVAAVHGLAGIPGALEIEAQAVTRAPQAAVRLFEQHLGVEAYDGPLPEPPVPLGEPWTVLWNRLAPQDRQLAEDALGGFHEGGSPTTLRWGAALFKCGPQLEDPLLGPVDITGRARILLQGPFINLSHGVWQVTVRLGISEAAAQQELLLEALTDRTLASIPVRAHGEHAVAFTVKIDELTDTPFFLRLSTIRAAFDGEVALYDTTLVAV